MLDPVQDALRELFGLPASASLRWSRDGCDLAGRFGSLSVQVAGLSLDVVDGGRSELPPWLEAGDLELRVAQPSAPSSSVTRLARRIGGSFVAGSERSAPVLRASLGLSPGRTFAQLAVHHQRDGHDIWHHVDGEAQDRIGLLRLGFRCNQDCWFCWQGRDWPDAPGADKERIDRLADEGATTLSITGGEPTAYRELPALIAHGRARGMQVSIQTNAIALGKPRLLGRLLEAGLNVAFVSFHSADPDVSDAMTRAPSTWLQTVAGIEAALHTPLAVRLNCVVEDANVRGLAAHARFIVQRFASLSPGNLWGVSYSHPSRYFDDAVYAAHVASLDTVRPHLTEAATTLMDAGIDVELAGSCGFPVCAIADVPGALAQVRHASFPAVQTASRVEAEACRSCAVVDRCLGPRREYLAVHGEAGLRPIEAGAGFLA